MESADRAPRRGRAAGLRNLLGSSADVLHDGISRHGRPRHPASRRVVPDPPQPPHAVAGHRAPAAETISLFRCCHDVWVRSGRHAVCVPAQVGKAGVGSQTCARSREPASRAAGGRADRVRLGLAQAYPCPPTCFGGGEMQAHRSCNPDAHEMSPPGRRPPSRGRAPCDARRAVTRKSLIPHDFLCLKHRCRRRQPMPFPSVGHRVRNP